MKFIDGFENIAGAITNELKHLNINTANVRKSVASQIGANRKKLQVIDEARKPVNAKLTEQGLPHHKPTGTADVHFYRDNTAGKVEISHRSHGLPTTIKTTTSREINPSNRLSKY